MAEVATAGSLSSWTAWSNATTKGPPAAGTVASTVLSALERVGNASAASTSAFEGPLRTAFLGAFTVVAFVGNLLLVLAIAQSRTLRTTAINVHLMGMAVANFVFCAVDMPLMIASSVAAEWEYGATVCSIFSYLHLVPSVEYVLGILCLSIDRLAVAKRPPPAGPRGGRGGDRDADSGAFARAVALAVGCWVVAASAGVPLLLTSSVPSAWYPDSYACGIGVGDDASLIYSAVIYSCLFTLPPVLTVILLMMTASATLRDREDSPRHAAPPRTPFRAADDDYADRRRPSGGTEAAGGVDPRGARGAVFVLLLFVLWIIFVSPHTALASVELYSQSIAGTGLSPQSSHVLSLVFMWLVCAHNMVLPFAAFVWRRDIWRNFKDVLTWHKSTTAVGVVSTAAARSARGRLPTTLIGGGGPAPPEQRFPARFKVPVLVATETGLHVHDDDNNNDAATDEERRGAACASDAYDDRHVFYADLTTRSNEITTERGRGTVASSNGSDQADEPIDYALVGLPSLPAVADDRRARLEQPLPPERVGSPAYGASPFRDAAEAAAAGISVGQAHSSLSTDSGLGSAAGSADRKSRKQGKARARGPLLVRTGSQPPAEPERGGGEPLPRMLLPPLALSGKGPWLPPAQVSEYGSPADEAFSFRREAGVAAVSGGLAADAAPAPRDPRQQLGWAAEEDAAAAAAAAGSQRRRRKKKRANRDAVVSLPAAALASYGGSDINLPLRPARLAPIALTPSSPITAEETAYGASNAEPGWRGAHVAEEGF